MKSFILIILLLSISNKLLSQEKHLKDSMEILELSKKVSDYFGAGKISKCFQELGPYWPLPDNEIEGMEDKTIKYMNIIEERFGKVIGVSKIKNEVISDFAIRETYLIRYEYTAIRLIYTYYKNDKGWIVNAFKWDDSFTDEFK